MGGERMATIMVRDRNYERPGFNNVQAIAEGGRLNRMHEFNLAWITNGH
jgi:hypothetical protein